MEQEIIRQIEVQQLPVWHVVRGMSTDPEAKVWVYAHIEISGKWDAHIGYPDFDVVRLELGYTRWSVMRAHDIEGVKAWGLKLDSEVASQIIPEYAHLEYAR